MVAHERTGTGRRAHDQPSPKCAMESADAAPFVVTVAGPVRAEELGATLCFEHVARSVSVGSVTGTVGEGQEIPIHSLGSLRLRPFALPLNGQLDSTDLVARELKVAARHGVGLIVDQTLPRDGRSPAKLRDVAVRCGARLLIRACCCAHTHTMEISL